MDEERPAKRFKYRSHAEALRDVHAPSALAQTKFDEDIPDNASHFHEALNHWRQLNLSPAFIRFANSADGLSSSMPLLLHHWREIMDLWIKALSDCSHDALVPLLDLMHKFVHDLRTTLLPVYSDLLGRLLGLLSKTIPPESLTALLATLSTIFKHMLVPSVDPDMLRSTWTSCRETLPLCDVEVQRATAETWGGILRRLKAKARKVAIILMLEGIDQVEDVCAWSIVFACKSVSQTLHTATSSLLTALLRYHVFEIKINAEPEKTRALLRRTITALVHHSKGPEQFAPIGDLLVDVFAEAVREYVGGGGEEGEEKLGRAMEVVAVACSVRKGSRLSQNHISTLLAQCPYLPLTEGVYSPHLTFITSLLTASSDSDTLPITLGPGRQILERAWGSSQGDLAFKFALELSGVLAELGWGGWRTIGLPAALRAAGREPGPTVRLLAALSASGKLGGEQVGVGVEWKEEVAGWVINWLQTWVRSEENVQELADMLTISPLLPLSVVEPIMRLVNTTLEEQGGREEYERTYANAAWVVGTCMRTLAARPSGEWTGGVNGHVKVDLGAWMRSVARGWAWNACVLDGLVALIEASTLQVTSAIPYDDLYPSFRNALLSHRRDLRLNALRILASSLVARTPEQEEAVRSCLRGEEVSVNLQGIRERVIKIRKVGQTVRGEAGVELGVRWLLAQLKVNLRPLWVPVIETLVALTERHGELVWGLVFHELKKTSSSEVDGADEAPPEWQKAPEDADAFDDDTWEDERTWRDPSGHRLRSVVGRWLQGGVVQRKIRRAQTAQERFDRITYEAQLLNTLGECASLAEKHNRDVIPFFLSISAPESPLKLPRPKITAWLTLFSKFSNPKALYSTETLHALYTSLLAHPDRNLQRLALSCILTYKSPRLVPREDDLRMLLDETKWRDQLTLLDVHDIEPQDRRELVDVFIRLLYGVMLERRGRSRGADRRAAVLTALGGCTEGELSLLVDLMLQPMRGRDWENVPAKQQVGFLTLLGDVMRNLGSRLTARWPDLLEATTDMMAYAQKFLDSSKSNLEQPEEGAEDEEALEEDDTAGASSKGMRTVRQLGLKRFADFFRSPVDDFDFTPFMKKSFGAFISPRLAIFDQENTQAPSALMDLFYVWTSRKNYVRFLVEYDDRTLPKIYDCLVAASVKPSVVSRVFDIVEHLLAFAAVDDEMSGVVLKPHVPLLLTNISILVERSKGVAAVTTPLGQRQITILSEIAQFTTDETQASKLLSLFIPVLRKPSKLVNEKVKINLLKILHSIIPIITAMSDSDSTTFMKAYEALSLLFQSLRGHSARIQLIATFSKLASVNHSLDKLADLVESLNAFSKKRLDEPDFDRRLATFATLNESLHSSLSARDWIAVLYCMLHFIQDPEELAVRNNASFAIKRFMDAIADNRGDDYNEVFVRILYPALKNALRTKHELVRAEVLDVLAYAVAKCDSIDSLREMRVLLAGGDEEANFFNNILHVQVHRRTRALRRLAEHCDASQFRSSTLAEVLVPLVGNFITSTSMVDHLLVNEAINTTGHMARQLGWGAYYSLVQQYLRLCQRRDESERVYVRALVAILDNFHFPMGEVVTTKDDENLEDQELNAPPPAPTVTQGPSRIEEVVNTRLLPSLLRHLESRDETEDALRIPISIGIIKIAQHLPATTREPQILRLLTIVSQILRSKSQDTRDLVKETLCRIAVILGPNYLPIMVQELRTALQRGPHLHVLAFAVHAILVHITSPDHADVFTTVDECVHDVVHVSAEVIFGQSGKDVQSEDFKTKMREVRSSSSKALDSFAIAAKHVSPSRISSLLVPIRAVMHETETFKVMQQVDEIMRRIASGLNSNKLLVPSELLVLCHTLISQNARFLQQIPVKDRGKPKPKHPVQLKRPAPSDADHYANNSYRFVTFGLDLFVTAFRRSRFDFEDRNIIARLEPMTTVIGNAMYSNNGAVITLSLKAAAAIVKCPLKSVDKSLSVITRRIIDIIKETGSTGSEIVQTAFKSLSAILRDCSGAQVKEKDLTYLLELLSPDLEEPTRQVSVFTMLKAIVSRKFVVPEIYDVMDRVSEIMVTNQSSQVQELCRSVLLQFLLDYPQGKGRLRNQMTFLAKNLSYTYESGRKSVMELLAAVISKFDPTLMKEYADMLFIALVMVIANDDSVKCREMAGELIKTLFSRLETDHRRVLVSHLHSWASQANQPQLARVSSQVYGLIVDGLQKDFAPYVPAALEDLNATLYRSAQNMENFEEDHADVDTEWQVPYHVLVVFSKILRTFPESATQPDNVQWDLVVSHLLYPHAWVRTASCRLLGILFSLMPVAAPDENLPESSPLSKPGMEAVAKKLCTQLKSEYLDEGLGTQIVKNLFWIGKCFCAVPLPSPERAGGERKGEEEGEEEESDEEEDEDEEDAGRPRSGHLLPWLFSNLSYQARSAHIGRRSRSSPRANWNEQPTAILKWFAGMASYMAPEQLERFLVHILNPVYRFTEDDDIKDPKMDELKTLAIELQDLVQAKVGTTKFAEVYNRIRQGVLGVRRERKTARALQVTTNPEMAAKRKVARNVNKRESKKRKNAKFVEGKGRLSSKKRRQE